jgi:hypothetical protein
MAQVGGIVKSENIAGLVKLLQDFFTQIELLAEAKTKEWAQHFSQRINPYERNSIFVWSWSEMRLHLLQNDQTVSLQAELCKASELTHRDKKLENRTTRRTSSAAASASPSISTSASDRES